jgi:transcriptional regulator with XRE-family HTH domain
MQTKPPVLENYFSRLQKAVESRGISLTDLAAETRVALSTMYRWKESAPQQRTNRQIAERLRVSEVWLREGIGEMELTTDGAREETTPYKFVPRGPHPQPTQAPDLHAGCLAMLHAMPQATTTQAFDYAVLAFEQTWEKFKAAKYSDLNQLPP